MIRALEAMLDRNITRGEVDQASGDEERRYFAWSTFLEKHRGVGNAGEAADAGADHRSGGAAVLLACGMPVGVVERLACRAHGEDDEVVDLALVLWLHPLVRIECPAAPVTARHLTGDLAGQVGDIEGFDLSGAALATQDALPGRLNSAGEWRHHAEARDDNPPHCPVLQPRIGGL